MKIIQIYLLIFIIPLIFISFKYYELSKMEKKDIFFLNKLVREDNINIQETLPFKTNFPWEINLFISNNIINYSGQCEFELFYKFGSVENKNCFIDFQKKINNIINKEDISRLRNELLYCLQKTEKMHSIYNMNILPNSMLYDNVFLCSENIYFLKKYYLHLYIYIYIIMNIIFLLFINSIQRFYHIYSKKI